MDDDAGNLAKLKFYKESNIPVHLKLNRLTRGGEEIWKNAVIKNIIDDVIIQIEEKVEGEEELALSEIKSVSRMREL